ncbi:MAG: hypothetical protein IJT12_03970 [Paludibacteraceae bacterium]|nr:hypothetical protein [Paludibacteraceae bacterium]
MARLLSCSGSAGVSAGRLFRLQCLLRADVLQFFDPHRPLDVGQAVGVGDVHVVPELGIVDTQRFPVRQFGSL